MPKGALQKLKISGYEDPGYNRLASIKPNPISVMINPTSYSKEMATAYTCEDAAGGTGQSVAFERNLGSGLDLSLVFDGTGTVPDAPTKSVEDQLADLRRLAYEVNGKIHSPNYVKLSWGTLLFKGRLTGLSIEYTLFAPDGTPLRAKAKAGFIGFHENREGRAAQNLNSPDLTHAVTVEAGDTLPLLCHRIYGDSRYYLPVAAHNRLDDFRGLKPGTLLLFPPLDEARS
jgi:nucleoid-associated protein YgaU